MLQTETKSKMILDAILDMLGPFAARSPSGNGAGIDLSTRLLDVGLVSSKDLLDIILEVENRCGVLFNPERIDAEKGITLGSLVDAFDPS